MSISISGQPSLNDLAKNARVLAPGEKLRDGDIYLNAYGEWCLTDNEGEEIETIDYQYRRPSEPTFNFAAYITAHAKWSRATFGDSADITGQVKHIRKELKEIIAAPGDITEPIDVIILALDILTRRGHTPAEICAALAEKQAVNKARKWPAPVAGKPTEHIKDS